MSIPLFLICIVIILIPAYVYLNMYMHFPPLPYSYTVNTIFIYMRGVMFYIYTHLFVFFRLFLKLNGHLCYGAYRCNHTLTHILILRFLLYFNFVIYPSTIVRSKCIPQSSKQETQKQKSINKIIITCIHSIHNKICDHKTATSKIKC